MTKTQLAAGLRAAAAVADAIHELRQVPSGTLYARLCGVMPLETYTALIECLKRTGLVTETAAHVLTWTGPAIEPEPFKRELYCTQDDTRPAQSNPDRSPAWDPLPELKPITTQLAKL